ncbi:uncharacterized protein B0H18DRAFT_1124563 [Fomitopsis serialis]|uniref:uncharacterized protein n=1 Tax=Fomitopsis serialis TaxID=139415 RepID=UPI002007D6CC|nr:uncharacterized protein B0H18DRAFT_1124563 [Neoantrodia serialis]KAH9915882.1 hypothetical protein B0H18DRAFT_1124563 [Neoantrodia serialis]
MAPSKHDRFYFDDGNAIFLVEETLFNVHRYFLKRDSPVFQDMFSMHSDEGRTDDNPILLEGTKSADFACLLACLYPSSIGEIDVLQAEEWAAVLDLAVKWQFDSVRKLAVKQMMRVHVDSPTLALQITTARRHQMHDWYLDAVLKMCERSRPISPSEGELLGLLETIRISAMRQKLRQVNIVPGYRAPPPPPGSHSIYSTMSTIDVPYHEQLNIRTELGLPVEKPTPRTESEDLLTWSPTGFQSMPASRAPSPIPYIPGLYD